jgi:predicted HD superfamily hydrolase involved in NAD metabolism
MDLQELRDRVKDRLSEARYQHSLGVEEVCCDLAIIYGYDPRKASVAGILHDCAKDLTDEELLTECERYHLPISEIEHLCKYLLHGKVGAAHAKDYFGIKDEDILNSIIYHTTGRPAMSLLEKIVFTADYIEPYRRPLPRIDEIRRTAYENLDLAVSMILENTLRYLRSTGATFDTLTMETYDYYKTVLQTY